jgi:hypothetical protein
VNGKPGDNPLTDILIHRLTVFSPEIDSLIKDIVALGGETELETKFNLFSPPPPVEFEKELKTLLSNLKQQAKERGWEVD